MLFDDDDDGDDDGDDNGSCRPSAIFKTPREDLVKVKLDGRSVAGSYLDEFTEMGNEAHHQFQVVHVGLIIAFWNVML